ncbi:MAG: tRNA glutamyl-Q(34) synthetase GluQRS [Alphaproteobacteria bacterium]|nr:tRNA glutamyl-Q(34) synthetase GluQRS [Alphaproteobacteria bacterium]
MTGVAPQASPGRVPLSSAAPPALVTRFAPSPTGYLHLGHVRSALEAWRAARRDGGRFLLRLEDIDRTRCRDAYGAAILEDLAWLGLTWDGAVRKQSEHFDDYRAALDRLAELDVLYPCFCTRREIEAEIARSGGAPHGPAGPPYPGTCRRLDPAAIAGKRRSGLDYALRLDATRAVELTGALDWLEDGHLVHLERALLEDVVLARKEVPASYHLAVSVDDALQGVTLVTRGADLAPATHIHRVLQALLGLATPGYRHHPLLTDTSGRRLSKRDSALTVRAMRQRGMTPGQIIAAAMENAPPPAGAG